MKFSRLVLTTVIFTLEIAGFAVRTTPQTTTHIKTVWIILMENHNWSQIIGSKSAPYINSTLLPIASHAEQYFNPPGIHPSEPNYLWLEAGTNFGILDDNEPAVNHQSATQHLATFLQNKNISWKSYQENIDGTTCPLVSSGLYATKHNPFVFFDDVTNNLNANSANCIAHIRPFTEITNDLATGNVAHLATFLQNKNISWKSYQENIDGTTCLLVSSGLYATKHNPFVFFDDVTNNLNANSANCIAHIRPFTEITSDLATGNVAQYNFITPNLCDDMHDKCKPLHNPIKQGDTWLSQNLPQILNSAAYQNGGAVFVTWDEAATGDGPIGMIVLSPFAKGSGYQNSIHYTHGSTLRTFQEIFGVTPLLNDAANETDLSDLFSVFP